MSRKFVFSYVNGWPNRAAVWYQEKFVLVGDVRGTVLTPDLVKDLLVKAWKRIESFKINQLRWDYEDLLLRGLKIDRAFGAVEPFFEYLYDKEVSPRIELEDITPLFENARGIAWATPRLHRRQVSFVSDRFDPYKEEYYRPVRAWLGWEERREEK